MVYSIIMKAKKSYSTFPDAELKSVIPLGSEPDPHPQPEQKRKVLDLSYLIDENPPWYICLLLGFQVNKVGISMTFFLVLYHSITICGLYSLNI